MELQGYTRQKMVEKHCLLETRCGKNRALFLQGWRQFKDICNRLNDSLIIRSHGFSPPSLGSQACISSAIATDNLRLGQPQPQPIMIQAVAMFTCVFMFEGTSE